jgi:hypothetical protein
LDPVQNAVPERRGTVFGLEPLHALFVPVFVWTVAELVTQGIQGPWDVVVALAGGVYSLSLAAALILLRRARARDDQASVRRDWLLTAFLVALTVLLLVPDDRASWAWAPGVVFIITGILLAARESRRRLGARRLR